MEDQKNSKVTKNRRMESQQFIEEGRKYVSSSSDEALPGSVSEKVHLTNSNFDVSRRSRRRAVLKDGYTNTFNSNVPLAGLTSITQDFFTFMMECRWRTLLLLFFTSFVISWLIFAVLYWAVAFGRGDLRGYEEFHDPTKEPCVTMMDDFISCFLFSMETQYSSGYGTRSPTTECPEAVFLVGFQSIFGALLQLSMSGIIFAKFARPKMRHQAIMFSHKAVISLRDRNLCLMFRVGDCRKSRLLGATLYARLLQHRVSAEGEKLPHYQHALKLSVDSSGSNIFLLWPLTAVHRIDSTSPLYDISADDLASASFELFVVLSGTVETMGQDTEARTSYTASEILWGHRLVPLVKTCGRGYILDYSRFHTTVPVDTPRCSARQLFSWTHNYVLLNKDGLLGNKDGYLDKDRFLNKDRFSDKDRFLENKDQFLENRDQFLENRDQFLDNKDRFSDNKDQFLEKDRFLENKDQFLDNKDQFLDNMDRLLSKRDIFFKDKDDGLLDNKDQVLSNKDELLVKKNQFMGNMDGMLDKKDQVLGNNDGILGTNAPFSSKTDEEQFLGNNDRFLSNNDRFLNSKEELLDNKGKCLGKENERLSNMDDFFNKDELLSNKDEFFDSKDQFLSNNDRLLSTKDQFMGKDGSFDSKDESLSNKDRLLGKDPPREEPHLKDGHFLGAEYREENETAENLSNLSGPVRKLSKIQKECPKKELHHSLMSLHDRKQQRGLSTLSEDNLR